MRKRKFLNKQSERGFTLLSIVIVVTALAAVGIIGVVVAMRIQQSNKIATQSQQQQAATQDESVQKLDPAVFATYHSNGGAFTMQYPKSWIVQGVKGDVVSTVLDGNEDQLRFQVAPDTSRTNNYGGTFRITAEAPGDEPWPIFPSGVITQTFDNSIGLWRDNQSQVLAQGRVNNTCPTLRIATEEGFGFKLRNGKYISYTGSFCWTSGLTTTTSYGQQLASDEFTKTADMIESIQQD